MTTTTAYRVQLPAEIVDFLVEVGSTLACAGLRTHVRDGADYDQRGWTYLTPDAVAVLRDLDPDSDGHIDDTGLWVGGSVYPLEPGV